VRYRTDRARCFDYAVFQAATLGAAGNPSGIYRLGQLRRKANQGPQKQLLDLA